MAEYYRRPDFRPAPGAGDAAGLLGWAVATAGAAPAAAIYRRREGRCTLRFECGGRGFFLKLHRGVGWRELIKNISRGRLPATSARPEYRAIGALAAAGVATAPVAAYARRGWNPAALESALVTDELAGTVSLEDYCAHWGSRPPPWRERMRLIRAVADIARRMHDAGINHRDFYLCHLHLDPATAGDPEPLCYLLDLHRAGIRRRVPRRWRIKDLAGLYFSALDCGLGDRDLLRFIHHYTDGGLGAALRGHTRMWQQVGRRARRLYAKNS